MNHHKPFDIVEDTEGNIGIITEVSLVQGIYSYNVEWFKGSAKNAWWWTDELSVLGNVMETIAKRMCHPFGNSSRHVSKVLFNTQEENK